MKSTRTAPAHRGGRGRRDGRRRREAWPTAASRAPSAGPDRRGDPAAGGRARPGRGEHVAHRRRGGHLQRRPLPALRQPGRHPDRGPRRPDRAGVRLAEVVPGPERDRPAARDGRVARPHLLQGHRGLQRSHVPVHLLDPQGPGPRARGAAPRGDAPVVRRPHRGGQGPGMHPHRYRDRPDSVRVVRLDLVGRPELPGGSRHRDDPQRLGQHVRPAAGPDQRRSSRQRRYQRRCPKIDPEVHRGHHQGGRSREDGGRGLRPPGRGGEPRQAAEHGGPQAQRRPPGGGRDLGEHQPRVRGGGDQGGQEGQAQGGHRGRGGRHRLRLAARARRERHRRGRRGRRRPAHRHQDGRRTLSTSPSGTRAPISRRSSSPASCWKPSTSSTCPSSRATPAWCSPARSRT